MIVKAISAPIVRAAAGLSVLLGAAVMIGWALDIGSIKSGLPGATEVKPNVAIALILAGGSLFIARRPANNGWRRLAILLGAGVGALGLATLAQHLFGWDFAIDELLWRDPAPANGAVPGRMAPASAGILATLGIALSLLAANKQRLLVLVLGVAVATIGAVGVLGYLWHISELVTEQSVPMAVHSAVAFLVLGVGTLVAQVDRTESPLAADPARAAIVFKVAIAITGAFLLLLVGGGVAYRSNDEFARSAQRVADGHEVRTRLMQLYVSLSDAETAARAYTLSGMTRHRDELGRFVQQARQHCEALAVLMAGNPAQRKMLERLSRLIAERIAALETTIAAYDAEGYDRARVAVAAETGSRVMDAIRETTQEIDAAEAERLSDAETQAREGRRRALFVLGATLLCASAGFALLIGDIRREMLARALAEGELRSLNAQLERRVEERTAAVTANVAERARINEALHQSEALFRQTLDNMLEGCQIIGFDWTYRYLNAAAARQLRRPVASLVGQTVTSVFPKFEGTEIHARIRRCMEERVTEHAEMEVALPDGARAWFQLTILPAPEGVSIFSVEITKRKRAEAEIRTVNADLERRVAERTAELEQAREAAEAASRAKSAFLATMSHEIRTPMNGVVGMLDVLSQSRLSEDQSDAVRTIRTSAFALLRILDDVLDFSKIEAGKLDLERSPVALTALIESICSTLAPFAAEKNVELELFVAPTLPAQVWCDPTRVHQVLFNLVGNAIKFSGGRPRPGRVSVRVDLAPGQGLMMRVSDDGIGMDEKTLATLFTSFTQAEASTTRRFGGTGLGLAICKRLVELMKGEIMVTSALGQGSVFTVIIPLEPVEGVVDRSYADLAGLDCFLVSDDARADDLRTYLEHAGTRVHMVQELSSAVAQARRALRPVVVHAVRDGRPTLDEVRAAFAPVGDVRFVSIAKRASTAPQEVATDVVTLDRNALRRWSLLRAVAVAAGRASPEIVAAHPKEAAAAEPAPPPTIAEARASGQLLLIAEDDEINQKLILRQIEMLGYAAEMANDGAEALRLWRNGRYGLVLTDLHMPNMDGYDLTTAIRREEAQRGIEPNRRTPIVALTANALRGEAARAEAAGMDQYLTKPLQVGVLRTALEHWLRSPSASVARSPSTDARPAPPLATFDPDAIRRLVGDDASILRELLSDYRASARRLVGELNAAHAVDAVRQVGSIAHKLKSSSRSVGALALGDLCAELENACRLGAGDVVAQCVAQLDPALRAVEGELDQVLVHS